MQSTFESGELSHLLHRASEGDQAALNTVIQHSCERVRALTKQMLHGFPGVRRWTETDDVLQNALLRLLRALRNVKPSSGRELMALAALQIRRELIDLARSYNGPEGLAANHDSQSDQDGADDSHEPCSLAQWTELHQQIEELPAEEKEVVDLVFYEGLDQKTAAEILEISLRTLQRRWHNALCKLHRIWRGDD